ncbi:hypothetical protein ACQKGO_14180 [Corallococcus interemptor]|uniref:hypothetical protein n=1 Tax=Corallococcus interemptor TaxID=2316720 RepID=UPI003CFC7C0C
MNKNTSTPQVSSRKTIRYHFDRLKEHERPLKESVLDPFDNQYGRMLSDDISNGILPWSSESTNFDFALNPANKQTESLITQALRRNEYSRDLASATSEFIRNCAQEILNLSEATYELVYFSSNPSSPPVTFRLEYFDSRTLVHRKGRLYQYVPEELRAEHNLPSMIELDKGKIFTFTPPALSPDWKSTLNALSSFRMGLPEFALAAIGNQDEVQFEWQTHFSTQEVALAGVTRALGWNARDLLGKSPLEYYVVHRALLFERFKIQLRSSIISQINKTLDTAGKQLGFQALVSTKGLPTNETIVDAQEKLHSGSASFGEILKPFCRR